MNPPRIPGVPASKLPSFFDYLASRGADSRAVLAGSPLAVLAPAAAPGPGPRVPADEIPLAWWLDASRRAAAFLGDPDFGLGYGLAFRGMPTMLGFLLSACRTLGEALDKYLRYQALEHAAWRLAADRRAGRLELRFVPACPDAADRAVIDFVFASLVGLHGRLCGEALVPRLVAFSYPRPARTAAHVRIFGCPLRFAAEGDVMVLDAGVLDRPVRDGCAGVAAQLETALERQRLQAAVGTSLAVRVLRALDDDPDGTVLDARDMAGRLGLGLRDMQAKLRAEGTAFLRLRDAWQKERALGLLALPGLSNQEIAFRLGFSEPSAFHRALRRWTGRSAGELRSPAGS
jgi:AraC-like DNA-binding protein